MSMNCPNCGDRVPEQIALVAMVTCPSCATTLYLDGARLRDAGQSGEMHDGPQLFDIGDTVKLGRLHLDIMGHARFSYGRGWWDEYWGTDQRGEGHWVSVDEGDIIVQRPLSERPPVGRTSRVGALFKLRDQVFRVTEVGEGECVALRGSFGERLLLGETYGYLNASGEEGGLLSGEFQGGESDWFLGDWVDPFDVVIEAHR